MSKDRLSNYEFPYGEKVIWGYLSKGVGGQVAFVLLCLAFLLLAWSPVWVLHRRFN